MILIFYKNETNGIAEVTGCHYKPELLSEEKKGRGIEVEEVPTEPDITEKGKTIKTFVNLSTGEVWHEIVDRPLSAEEKEALRLEQLEQRMDDADDIMFDLLLGN